MLDVSDQILDDLQAKEGVKEVQGIDYGPGNFPKLRSSPDAKKANKPKTPTQPHQSNG